MALASLVDACAQSRDLKSCDPTTVGPDDRIPLNSERRLVRYGWLRVLFSKAEEPDEPQAKAARDSAPPPPATSQLLREAQKRLARDLAQAGAAVTPSPAHPLERSTLSQVLSGRDFSNLRQPSVRDSMLEKVNNWLNHLFESVAGLRAKSAWVGRLIVWGFILVVCIALAWALLQLERRWRVRLVPDDRAEAPASAASARNYHLWLEDARRAAALGQWRQAIHFVYWAAISRLESRRLWPADRARTPREYLALVAPGDHRRPILAALTGAFERAWYGGRPAEEADYRRAEELASALIASGPAAKPIPEGGAR